MSPFPLFRRRAVVAAVASLAASVLAGCTSVGPDYEAPRTNAPTAFRESSPGLLMREAELATWWRRFEDPILDQLIVRAARANHDLLEALERIAEARALRGAAAAEYSPTVDVDAAYQRRHESENTPLGGFAVDADRFTLGVAASWEVDLWGRVRRSVEAADADLGQQIETARIVAVAVAAETASNYVQLRGFQERLAIARRNLTLQEQTLALVRSRFEAGLVGERDVAQAASNLASTRARVPALESSLRAAENRLAVLLGEMPGSLASELDAVQPIPAAPAEVAVGVPGDLLRRRPDVRAAERAFAAATARIGVATADLYPRLTLFGSTGFESDDITELFDGGSSVMAVGPSLRWNVFDAGRVRRRIEAQDARARQALVRFERTVLVALEEAENAMTAFVRERTRSEHLAEAASQARRAAGFAATQYREGLTDFQNVLDSERALVELEDQWSQSRAAISTGLIALYRALGGGWDAE